MFFFYFICKRSFSQFLDDSLYIYICLWLLFLVSLISFWIYVCTHLFNLMSATRLYRFLSFYLAGYISSIPNTAAFDLHTIIMLINHPCIVSKCLLQSKIFNWQVNELWTLNDDTEWILHFVSLEVVNERCAILIFLCNL